MAPMVDMVTFEFKDLNTEKITPEENLGKTRQGHRDSEGPAMRESPRFQQGPGCSPRAEKGGLNRHGNGSRRRHSARGAGTSSGDWRAAAAAV